MAMRSSETISARGRTGSNTMFSAPVPISLPEDRGRIFDDEYRGSNVLNKPGTGHGLAFIKIAVELHGGIVGYEPTQYGNNFFLILPRE